MVTSPGACCFRCTTRGVGRLFMQTAQRRPNSWNRTGPNAERASFDSRAPRRKREVQHHAVFLTVDIGAQASVYGPVSLTPMCTPGEPAVHAPHPLKRTAEIVLPGFLDGGAYPAALGGGAGVQVSSTRALSRRQNDAPSRRTASVAVLARPLLVRLRSLPQAPHANQNRTNSVCRRSMAHDTPRAAPC